MMRLPHTDNAEHLWAFKKGYRFAQQGKPLREMPLTIRTDRILRDYFEQGFEQAQQQLAAQSGPELTPKKRALWLLLTVVAGLATAKLMIDEMQQSAPVTPQPSLHADVQPPKPSEPKQASASAISSVQAAPQHPDARQPAAPAQADANPAPQTTNSPAIEPTPTQLPETKTATTPVEATPEAPIQATPDFSLLDEEARAKQLQSTKATSLPPVTTSHIQVVRAVLAAGVQNREPVGVLEEVVPKSMRRVYFFTEVKGAKGTTLIHRWRYGERVMAEVRLPIRSDDFRTWSSKRMSPAWAGRWWVEVVDENGQILERKGFRYVR